MGILRALPPGNRAARSGFDRHGGAAVLAWAVGLAVLFAGLQFATALLNARAIQDANTAWATAAVNTGEIEAGAGMLITARSRILFAVVFGAGIPFAAMLRLAALRLLNDGRTYWDILGTTAVCAIPAIVLSGLLGLFNLLWPWSPANYSALRLTATIAIAGTGWAAEAFLCASALRSNLSRFQSVFVWAVPGLSLCFLFLLFAWVSLVM